MKTEKKTASVAELRITCSAACADCGALLTVDGIEEAISVYDSMTIYVHSCDVCSEPKEKQQQAPTPIRVESCGCKYDARTETALYLCDVCLRHEIDAMEAELALRKREREDLANG